MKKVIIAMTAVAVLISLPQLAWALFTSHTLVLQQDAVPLLDGVPTGSPYTGFVDTYVDSDNPSTTYFTDDYVRFGSKSGSGGPGPAPITRGYLRLDDFQSLLPAGAVITSSKLTLTSAGPDYLGSYNSSLRYRTASFDGINWSSAGTTLANTVGLTAIGSWAAPWATNNVQVVDVTGLTRQWQTGAVANNGLQFVGQEDPGWSGLGQRFYSSDYAIDTTKRPKVELQYVLPGVTNTLWGLMSRNVQLQVGPHVVQDTWIRSTAPTTPGGSATTGVVEEWTNGQRVLMKIDMTNPLLASLATSSEAPVSGRPKLVSASLQLQAAPGGVNGSTNDWLYLWKLGQDWDPATADWNTTDGSTPWSPAWINHQTSGGPGLTPSITSNVFNGFVRSHTLSFDVTSLLQSYVDGGTNYGFVISGSGPAWEQHLDLLYLSEYGTTEWFQPVLVLEFLEIPEPSVTLLLALGGLITLRARARNKR